MTGEDSTRWDERYQNDPHWSRPNPPRAYLVEHRDSLPDRGLALDAAMGSGNNAGFLIEHGLCVIGVDRSLTAVRLAKERFPELLAVQADLRHFFLPPAHFDLIINFYYFERSLFSAYMQALRPGGLLIFETMTTEMLQARPDINPEHLLKPDELRQSFSSLEILDYREGWTPANSGGRRARAAIVARRSALG